MNHVRKPHLTMRVSLENKEFLYRLSQEKNMSVSKIVDITISDLKNEYMEIKKR